MKHQIGGLQVTIQSECTVSQGLSVFSQFLRSKLRTEW